MGGVFSEEYDGDAAGISELRRRGTVSADEVRAFEYTNKALLCAGSTDCDIVDRQQQCHVERFVVHSVATKGKSIYSSLSRVARMCERSGRVA